jgi:hypothetical protein
MGAGSRIDLNGAGATRHRSGSAASCDAWAFPLAERYAMTVPANSLRNPGTPAGECGPWNPGIDSRLLRELLPLSTMFRPENVLLAVVPDIAKGTIPGPPEPVYLATRLGVDRIDTLGRWGAQRSAPRPMTVNAP